MDIAFRVDASAHIGSGHVMRCLNLARALRDKGASSRFVCRPHEGNLISLVEQSAFPVASLPAPAAGCGPGSYEDWVGARPEQDAKECIDALGGRKPDWLVADHYGLDAQWERRMRPHVGRIMPIDDLANRLHECDLLLDQNFHTEGARRYAGLVSTLCRLLIGPRFAILGPEYAPARRTARPRRDKVASVLVYFGDSDLRNATAFALDAMSLTPLSAAKVDVVVGSGYPHLASLARQLENWPQATLHRALPHLADLMVDADLAIGAGGTTTWERLCVGVPSVVVSVAANQRASCESLREAGLIEYAGDIDSIDRDHLRWTLESFLASADRLETLSERGRAMVDGLGAARVADAMLTA
jgi:UDP-2,4-diacetamido-2,4,6-trideoxy-beta-L-altropyranose hydrolase